MRSYGCVSKNGIGPLPQKKEKSKHLGVVSELAFPGEKKKHPPNKRSLEQVDVFSNRFPVGSQIPSPPFPWLLRGEKHLPGVGNEPKSGQGAKKNAEGSE